MCFSCSYIACPNLTDPQNGSVFTPDEPRFEDEATHSCDQGFELVGDSRRYCGSTGSWTGTPPTCVHTGTIFLTCEPPRGKTNNVVSEQVRHKPVCAVTENS